MRRRSRRGRREHARRGSPPQELLPPTPDVHDSKFAGVEQQKSTRRGNLRPLRGFLRDSTVASAHSCRMQLGVRRLLRCVTIARHTIAVGWTAHVARGYASFRAVVSLWSPASSLRDSQTLDRDCNLVYIRERMTHTHAALTRRASVGIGTGHPDVTLVSLAFARSRLERHAPCPRCR